MIHYGGHESANDKCISVLISVKYVRGGRAEMSSVFIRWVQASQIIVDDNHFFLNHKLLAAVDLTAWKHPLPILIKAVKKKKIKIHLHSLSCLL